MLGQNFDGRQWPQGVFQYVFIAHPWTQGMTLPVIFFLIHQFNQRKAIIPDGIHIPCAFTLSLLAHQP